jgi:hypothetical protein
LGFFDYTKVDLLAHDGDDLILQCAKPLKGRLWVDAWAAGQVVRVRLEVSEEIALADETANEGEGPRLRRALQILCQRLERQPMEYFYRATIRRPLEFWPHLRILLEPAPPPMQPRRHPRLGHRIRAMSPALPEYKATVRNLSESGIGLDLSAPLEKGYQLRLRLEPDGGQDTPFEMEAEVCWCRSVLQLTHASSETERAKAYEAGLRFLPASPESQELLSSLLESFEVLENSEPSFEMR